MLGRMIFLAVAFMVSAAFAETVDVHVKDLDPNQDINNKEFGGAIIIKKGSEKDMPQYEITQGEEEITGDSTPLLKQAQANWKKACAEWKKEMRENNKENQVISLNCGSMDCTNSTAESSCKSKGNYKLKIKTH